MDKKKVGKLSEVFGSEKCKKDIPQARIGGGMSFKEKKESLESFLGQHSEKSNLKSGSMTGIMGQVRRREQ